LVNDKESKTTDYRQAWTDSLRKCFASLISDINTLANLTTSRMKSVDRIVAIDIDGNDNENPELKNKVRTYLSERLSGEDERIRDLTQSVHESYALTRLHFKPNDLSFSRVEQKFDVIMELFDKLNSLNKESQDGDRKVLREKIRAESNELTAFSRDILKTEWEAVKRGESAYQRTKFWSLVGGAIALLGLTVFGFSAGLSFMRSHSVPIHEPTINCRLSIQP